MAGRSTPLLKSLSFMDLQEGIHHTWRRRTREHDTRGRESRERVTQFVTDNGIVDGDVLRVTHHQHRSSIVLSVEGPCELRRLGDINGRRKKEGKPKTVSMIIIKNYIDEHVPDHHYIETRYIVTAELIKRKGA